MPRNRSRWIGYRCLIVVLGSLGFTGCVHPTISWNWTPLMWTSRRNLAIPDMYPLGNVVRSHYHVMETNGEATDFILHDHEFVGSTAELTPAGKDHIMEIGARMRSAPFPVIIERSENNSDPELDRHRQQLVAQILNDFGNPDAVERTFVAPAYGKGINSREAEMDWYRHVYSRGRNSFGNYGNNNNNNFGNNFSGNGGGFGF